MLERASAPRRADRRARDAPRARDAAGPRAPTPSPRTDATAAESNRRVIAAISPRSARGSPTSSARRVSAAAVAQANAARHRHRSRRCGSARVKRATLRETRQRRESRAAARASARRARRARCPAQLPSSARPQRRTSRSERSPQRRTSAAALAGPASGAPVHARARAPRSPRCRRSSRATSRSARSARSQAIGELGEALRAVELLARTAATGGTFESSRGPRARDARRARWPGRRRSIAHARDRASRASARPSAIGSAGLAMPHAVRWHVACSHPTALAATAATQPAALGHVAWADRWLARFAGAAPRIARPARARLGGSPSATRRSRATSLGATSSAASQGFGAAAPVRRARRGSSGRGVRSRPMRSRPPRHRPCGIARRRRDARRRVRFDLAAAGRARIPARPAAAKPAAQAPTPTVDDIRRRPRDSRRCDRAQACRAHPAPACRHSSRRRRSRPRSATCCRSAPRRASTFARCSVASSRRAISPACSRPRPSSLPVTRRAPAAGKRPTSPLPSPRCPPTRWPAHVMRPSDPQPRPRSMRRCSRCTARCSRGKRRPRRRPEPRRRRRRPPLRPLHARCSTRSPYRWRARARTRPVRGRPPAWSPIARTG